MRQGCLLFPYLFTICTEVLDNAIWKDKEIHGINIGDMECKLSQHADVTMILDDSELSFFKNPLFT